MASQFTSQALSNYLSAIASQNLEDTEQTSYAEELKNQGVDMLAMTGAPALSAIKSGMTRVTELASKATDFKDKVTKAKSALEKAPDKAEAFLKEQGSKLEAFADKSKSTVEDLAERTATNAKEFLDTTRATVEQTAKDAKSSLEGIAVDTKDALEKTGKSALTQVQETGKTAIAKSTREIESTGGKMIKSGKDAMSQLKQESASGLDELKTRAGNQGAKLEGLADEPRGLLDRIKSAVGDKIASVKDKFSSPEEFDAGKQASKLRQQAFNKDPEEGISSAGEQVESLSKETVQPKSTVVEDGFPEGESLFPQGAGGRVENAASTIQDTVNTQIQQGRDLAANLTDVGADARGALENTAAQIQQEGTTALNNAESGIRSVGSNIEAKGNEIVNSAQDLAKSTVQDAANVGSNIAKEGSTILDEGLATGIESVSEIAGPVGDAIDAGLLLWQTFSGLKDILHQPAITQTPTATFQAGL